MPEPAEKIVFFDSFDNVIMANIIKTKLDAYGIPCFLTGENLTNLYPFQNDLFPGVRLYIFETDILQVRNILIEEVIPDSDILKCPHCGSKSVEPGWKKGGFLQMAIAALEMVMSPEKKVFQCQDCGHEFKP